MQYCGGKSRISKKIAHIILAERSGRILWEPFCGALSMTIALQPDLASDIHPGLIQLYSRTAADPNWLDDFECSEQDYQNARALPDADPLKAFIGFGCSFGGKWFGGFGRRRITAKNPHSVCHVSRVSLKKRVAQIRSVLLQCLPFDAITPSAGCLLYLDPPYSNTTLAGSTPFDQSRFLDLCESWARAGSIVFISEYDLPIGKICWRGKPQCSLGSGVAGGQSGRIGEGREERLYRL
jgi:DNA adenine methylase